MTFYTECKRIVGTNCSVYICDNGIIYVIPAKRTTVDMELIARELFSILDGKILRIGISTINDSEVLEAIIRILEDYAEKLKDAINIANNAKTLIEKEDYHGALDVLSKNDSGYLSPLRYCIDSPKMIVTRKSALEECKMTANELLKKIEWIIEKTSNAKNEIEKVVKELSENW